MKNRLTAVTVASLLFLTPTRLIAQQKSQAQVGSSGVWVLWAKYSGPKGFDYQEPLSGYETRAECMGAMRRRIDDLRRNPKSNATIDNDIGKATYGLKSDHLMEFTCLPDTIDPRGPKK